MSELAILPLELATADTPESATAEGEFASFPGSPFELFMPYPPAGDQPEAITFWSKA